VAGVWLEVVSPKRAAVAAEKTQVAALQSKFAGDQAQLSQDQGDVGTYSQDVDLIKQVSTAVPPVDGLPALIQALQSASQSQHVTFQMITVESSGGAGGGFTPMDFNFQFGGSYLNLQHFLHMLDDNTVVTSTGGIVATGRLFTINSVALSPSGVPGGTTATVSATAYMQGAGAGGTGATGATG
jgi:hypothetical protein